MATLSRTTVKATKGQGTATTATGQTTGNSSGTTTASARDDKTVQQKPSSFTIQFTVHFRAGSPVTPRGETEPDPACP